MDDDHRDQEPEEGKGDRDEPERMHEPRLVEVVEILVYEPEDPAEEHKRNKFSQCVYHGAGLPVALRFARGVTSPARR